MKAAWQALQIMWTLHNEHASGERSAKPYSLKIADQAFATDVYEPHVKYRGTIAVIHGMSPFGKEDRRIVMFCQAMCHVGFRVIAPDIQSIRNLQIEANQIQMIAQVLGLISRNNKFCPTGRLSILAPSFSGAMCLAAAAEPCLKDKVISVCAIGAFTQVDSVMEFLLTSNDADPYGRYIVLKKIIPLVLEDELIDNLDAIQQALDAAIADNINESSEQCAATKVISSSSLSLSKAINGFTKEERDLIEKILGDASFRSALFSSAKENMPQELAELDIVRRLDAISAKVLLLHGREDKVIPYTQSELLHKRLRALNKETDLVITPFISHGDTKFSLRMVRDVYNIIKGFSFFFEDLKLSTMA